MSRLVSSGSKLFTKELIIIACGNERVKCTSVYYYRRSMTRTSLGPWKCVRDMGSSSHRGLIMAQGWSGEAKVSCILRHRGVQLILAYSWARLAILVAGMGRGGMFLLVLRFHSC